MSHQINRPHALAVLSLAVFLCAAAGANAQDAMFVDSAGNVGVGTNTPSQALHVLRSDSSAQVLVEDSGSFDGQTMFSLINNGHPKFRMQDTAQSSVVWEFRTAGSEGGDERFQINKIGSGVIEARFNAGGDLVIGGSLTEGSSRSIKHNVTPLDGETVLAKLENLPVNEWSYQGDLQNRHVGPMAEDFYAIFGLGSDSKHIAPRDLAGVAVGAAKALNGEVQALRAENDQLRARLEKLEKKIGVTH